MEGQRRPAVCPAFLLRVAAVGGYLCVTVVARGADLGLGGLALVYGAGFALGALSAGWWSVAVGFVAALLFLGDSNDFGLAFASFPASVACGVLGAKMRSSEAGRRTALRMARAGAVILCVGATDYLVFAEGYNDAVPISATAGVGFIVAVFGVPVGLGLLCAGLVGSARRGVSS